MADSKILDMLPPAWRRNDLMRDLANTVGEPFDYWRTLLGGRGSFYDPDGAPSSWLDYLMRLTGWPPLEALSDRRRRNLVDSAARIWSEKGTEAALEFTLKAIGGIDAKVTNTPTTAFVAGVSVAGDVCGPGETAWVYDVEAPGATVEDVQRVLDLVQPAWTEANIQADPGPVLSRPSAFAPARPAEAFDYPDLDDRSADDVYDDVVSNLPSELSYREDDATIIDLVEVFRDTFFTEMLFRLNQTALAVEETAVKAILGVAPLPAQPANVDLEFTAAAGAGTVTIPKGTVVKTGPGADATAFETDEEATVSGGSTETVTSTATEPGADANDIGTGELTELEGAISGIDSVTNPSAPDGGEDEEPYEVMIQRWREETRAGSPARVVSPGDVARTAIIDPDDIDARVERAWVKTAGTWNNSDKIDQKAGSVAVAVVDASVNSDPTTQQSKDLRAAVVDELEAGAPDDIAFDVRQPEFRLVHVTKVDVIPDSEYLDANDEVLSDAETRAKKALQNYLTAQGKAGDARRVIKHPGWPWGKSLWFNELVSLLHDVDGIERVVDAYERHSDDGSSWTSESTFDEVKAAADGNTDISFGLLNWESSPGKTFSLNDVS